MFDTHWSLIPLSFFPAGIACGLLGMTPEGFLFTSVMFSLFWLHAAFYFGCRFLLKLELILFPSKLLLMALGFFILGYIIAYEYDNVLIRSFINFNLSIFTCWLFFIHDFVIGLVLSSGKARKWFRPKEEAGSTWDIPKPSIPLPTRWKED